MSKQFKQTVFFFIALVASFCCHNVANSAMLRPQFMSPRIMDFQPRGVQLLLREIQELDVNTARHSSQDSSNKDLNEALSVAKDISKESPEGSTFELRCGPDSSEPLIFCCHVNQGPNAATNGIIDCSRSDAKLLNISSKVFAHYRPSLTVNKHKNQKDELQQMVVNIERYFDKVGAKHRREQRQVKFNNRQIIRD